MADQMTYGEAGDVQYMAGKLRELVDAGVATPEEVNRLQELEARVPDAERERGATGAAYRGFKRGVTGGLSDDISGAYSAVTGGDFASGRDASLMADMSAQDAYPGAFGSGEVAGGGTLGGLTLPIGGPALKGASMGAKILAGGGIGSGLGAMQGQSDYEMAGSPEGQRWDYYRGPMIIGGTVGAAAYPVAAGVGRGVQAVRNARAIGGGAPVRTLTRAAQNTQDAGQDIKRFFGDLPPEAMLADVPGDMQGTAQGLAAIRGPGGTRVARAINERGDDAGARIAAEVDTRIGPANAAFEARRASANARTSLGPEYDAALNSAGAVNVSSLRNKFDEAMRVAGPDTAPVLRQYAADLAEKAQNGLIDPVQLHWLRSDLNRKLRDMGMGGTKPALLQNALDEVDKILDTIPGYKDARTAYGNTFAMDRAVDEGEDMLRGTRRSASSPEEFQAQWGGLSEPQRDAFRTGVRRDIAALMGTSRNDAAAAWRELEGKGWNQEKLRIVLGDDADALIRRLRGERVYSETGGKVVSGTRTSETNEARQRLGPYRNPETGQRPGPVSRARAALSDKASGVVDSLLYRSQPSKNAELGRLLTLQGPERDQLVQMLLQNALKAQSMPQINGNAQAVVRALMGAGAGAGSASQ